MKLKDLKTMMVLPEYEIPINKTVIINDIKVQFMCLTHSNNRNTIWAVYENINNRFDREVPISNPSTQTNREMMTLSIDKHTAPSYIPISKIYIQGNIFAVSSSSTGYISYHDIEGIMKLQHFSESQLLPDFLDEAELNNLCIARYSQKENESFPVIDTAQSIDMEIFTGKEHQTFLVNDSLTLGFSKLEINEYTFHNPITSKDCTYYLQPLEIYDIWEELEDKFRNQNFNNLSEEQAYQMTQRIERICPKGMKLAILKYETDEDITLNFYSKEYLISINENQGAALGLIIFPDEKCGPNGMPLRICPIKPINENSLQDIDIELFSFNMTHLETIIES